MMAVKEHRILEAIRSGLETTREIAGSLGERSGLISVYLCKMADKGAVVRARGDGTQALRWIIPDVEPQGASPTDEIFLFLLAEEQNLLAKLKGIQSLIPLYRTPTPAPSIETGSIQSSDGRAEGRALKGPTGSLREESQDTGPLDDRNERSGGSVTPRIEAGKVRMPAPSISQGREATRTEDLGRVVVERAVESRPSEALDLPPFLREIAQPALDAVSTLARAVATPEPVSSTPAAKVSTPPTAPKPPSAAAAALAGAALAIQASKTPPKASPKVAAAPAPVEPHAAPQDTRKPFDPFRALRAAEMGRGVTSFRPDPPAEKRGMVNVTSDLCGDPPPGRSALDQRKAAQ